MTLKISGLISSPLPPLLLASALLSCRSDPPAENKPDETDKVSTEEPSLTLAMEDRFDYPNGPLSGNKPPSGLSGVWLDAAGVEGTATVKNGVIELGNKNTGIFCRLDTSEDGPFAPWLDNQGKIGKDGTTMYVGFYQQILEPSPVSLTTIELISHPKVGPYEAKITSGWLDAPLPAGPFGIRLKRQSHLAIEAPEKMNGRENLIILKIYFGLGDRDRVTYYYNQNVEGKGDGSMASSDLSFDGISAIAIRGGKQRIRHFRFADNFEMVSQDE